MEFLDGQGLIKAIHYAAAYLETNKEEVNRLNVFPVPDGDTGTNMSLTIHSAAKNASSADGQSVEVVAKAISSGALMGARGNSGVVLSQLLRGFYEGCKNRKTLSVSQLAGCMKSSADMAYKAVIKPTEGTILTVARAMGNFATANFGKYQEVDIFLEKMVEEGEKALDKTPDMLPVLKEAGVVDAGGKGLIYIYKGFLAALKGEVLAEKEMNSGDKTPKMISKSAEGADIRFLYCTEAMIQGDGDKAPMLRTKLLPMGDSMVVVGDEDIIKVHIHTNEPGKVLSQCLTYGELLDIKIENMKLQHENTLVHEETYKKQRPEKRSKYAFVAVAAGEGIEQIFRDIGVESIIKGGQTMNPSTQDFLDEIALINAEVIYLLPNNKNIILAANQAKEVSTEHIEVIPTKTIPQGISAVLAFCEEASVEENMDGFIEVINRVKTGQITFSVRDTTINKKMIKKGNIIGINDRKGITAISNSAEKAAIELLAGMVDEESELIYIYYGQDTSQKEAQKLHKKLEKIYEDQDVILQYGGQPLYYYILSVE